ncbi:MAG: hypothetical protein LBQ73_07230 [Tannerellaceae bacterium]|nr:hypothetical protein [Tannerellaceae bacterium]
MSTILGRIEEIAKNERIKITTMERVIGASKGVLSRAINNGTDIQSKWIQAIVENYPNYSEEWLITGNGSMYKSPVANSGISNTIKSGAASRNVGSIAGNYVNVESSNSGYNKIIADQEHEIDRLSKLYENSQALSKELQTKIIFLEREIESLKDNISTQKELINMYKKTMK